MLLLFARFNSLCDVIMLPGTNNTVLRYQKSSIDYRIFWTIRRTYNPLIFSKIERAPYDPVRLVCGSLDPVRLDCALSPSSE